MALARSADFDDRLEKVIGDWESLSDMEREWPEMDDEERAIVGADWPSMYQMQYDVEAYARTQALKAERQAQMERLHAVMRRQWPILDRLKLMPPKRNAA